MGLSYAAACALGIGHLHPESPESQRAVAAKSQHSTFRIEIPNWWPALLNHYLYRHWRVVSRMKRDDRNTIAAAVFAAGTPKATGKRRVTVTLIMGPRQRKCDGDAPWKSLLDGLAKCGALVDDSTDWAEMAPLQFGKAGTKATIIELEDIG